MIQDGSGSLSSGSGINILGEEIHDQDEVEHQEELGSREFSNELMNDVDEDSDSDF